MKLAAPATYFRDKWNNSRVLRASMWSTVPFVVGTVMRIGGNLIMTRLLVPDMFGVMSIVLIIQTGLMMVSDVGLRVIVVQSKNGDDPSFLNTVWTLEVIRGVLIWTFGLLIALGLYLAAGTSVLPSGSAWEAPALPGAIAIALFAAVIAGFQSTRLMTANRNLDIKSLALVELAAQVAGLIAMIVLGLATRSIWALVSAGLVSAMVTTSLSHFWLSGVRNRFAWNKDALSEIYRSGRWVLLSSLIYVASSNADRLILAGYVNAAILGIYTIAFTLVALVEQVGTRMFLNVVLPSLSEKVRDNPESVGPALFRHRLPFDIGFLAAAGLVYATGTEVIRILYDDRYLAAGQILQMLSFLMVFSRYQIFGAVYMAYGKPQLMATMHVLKLVGILVFLPLAYASFGFEGAMVAIAFHALPAVIGILWINHTLKINNLLFELAVLPAWLVGYAAGLLGVALIQAIGI